jgi:hypothetical protein
MKSQKELWKPDLNQVSQGCQHEKNVKIYTQDSNPEPLQHAVVSILTLDHQSQIHTLIL